MALQSKRHSDFEGALLALLGVAAIVLLIFAVTYVYCVAARFFPQKRTCAVQ